MSRERAQSVIDEIRSDKEHSYWKLHELALDAATELDELLESPRPDWTPCAEGLPESDQWRDDGFRKTYRVTVEADAGELSAVLGSPYRYVATASFELGEWVLDSEDGEFDESDKVIAWMEQPEPYNPDHIIDANKKADQFREPTKMMQDDM